MRRGLFIHDGNFVVGAASSFIARVRELCGNTLVIKNLISIGNAAKLPFRDRSVLVKDTGHRSGTSERKLLQAGFGEFKTEAGPVR